MMTRVLARTITFLSFSFSGLCLLLQLAIAAARGGNGAFIHYTMRLFHVLMSAGLIELEDLAMLALLLPLLLYNQAADSGGF